MFKLLNRFAWIISITIWIIPIIIDYDFLILWIIIWLIVKFGFLSNDYIEDRLKYFAESIKNNYLLEKPQIKEKIRKIENNEAIINLGDLEKTKHIEDIEEKKKHIEELMKIQEQKNIDAKRLKEIEEQEKISDMKNNENYTQVKHELNAFDIFFEKIWNYIKEFFSTNILAKLGWILVFLAVVYFLSWVAIAFWYVIWPVWRIAIWIIVGFITYFIWVKIYPTYTNEGLILMWTWILINFAVILSGRYLVWDNWYLAEWTTFIFLILNTIFWVLTSLIYKSKTLLVFSFIFAYLNPFIIWAESNGQPYTLIWYSLIVSLWALYLSIREASLTLLAISFIAWNLLFLIAPFSDSIGWSSKIILTSTLSILTIIWANKFKWLKSNISKITLNLFIWAYIFIVLNLLNSWSALSETIGFIVYNFILISLFIFSIKLINKANSEKNGLTAFIFIPLIILTWILFSGNMIFSPFILVWTIVTYLVWFIFIQNISNIFSYFFFGVLSIFILIFNLDIWTFGNPSSTEFITIIITSLIFLFSSYYYSLKKDLPNLFPIWTIWTILILSPIIKNSGEFMNLSIITIIIFALSNLILSLINTNLFKKENIVNLIVWSIAWALFFSFQIYSFWELHFPWIAEGFAFLGLAIVYFVQWFFVWNKIWFNKMKSDESLKNTFYTFIAISISLFSIAIAFVFSNYPEIITTTWLFEATILYFFYSKTSSPKIFWAATILFIIWLSKFGILTTIVESKDYEFLISFWVILTSFLLNLFFINKAKENEIHNVHHILHIIWMIIMWILLLKIIPSTWHGWSSLGIALFITLLWSFYTKFNFTLLKIVFLMVIAIIWILHIWEISFIFYRLQKDNLEYLKILQYIVSAIIISNYFIWKKLSTDKFKYLNKSLLIIVSIYSFIISNIFIIDLFNNIFWDFTLTIYWGLIAASLLIYWIQNDIIKYRTIWLYFLTLTSAKIFLYDVWQIWNTNSRVVVFAILWVIFIIISTLYSKRFWDNMKWEFSMDNLKDKNNSPTISSSKKNKNNINKKETKQITKKEDFLINEEIKNIDVSDLKSVQFIFNNNKKISIRAVNLMKIVKLLIRSFDWQTEFKKNELKDIYDYVKDNYKSNISKSNYDKITTILEEFVKQGWKINLIKN